MNTEQLQAIAEIVNGLSGDAKTAFIVYVTAMAVVPCFHTIVTGGTILCIVGILYKLLIRVMKTVSASGRIAATLLLPGGCTNERELGIVCAFLHGNRNKVRSLLGLPALEEELV